MDTLGLVLKVVVTAGNVQDREWSETVLNSLGAQENLIQRLKLIWADGSYRGELIAWVEEPRVGNWKSLKNQRQSGFQALRNAGSSNAPLPAVRQRRLARDYERLPETSASFIYVAMIRLMLRRLALS